MKNSFKFFIRLPKILQIPIIGLVCVLIAFMLIASSWTTRMLFFAVFFTSFWGNNVSLVSQFKFGLFFSDGKREKKGVLYNPNGAAKIAHLLAERAPTPWSRATAAVIRSTMVSGVFLIPVATSFSFSVAVIVWILSRGLYTLFAEEERDHSQSERDRKAENIARLVSGNRTSVDYTIYFRPFAVTGVQRAFEIRNFEKARAGKLPTNLISESGEFSHVEMPVLTSSLSLVGDDDPAEVLNADLESALERGVHQFGSLVALGQAGETHGAGRIASGEDEWQTIAVKLADNARAILIVPSSAPGTLWELEYLRRSRNFRDCIFIAPGKQMGRSGLLSWSTLSEEIDSILRLPRYVDPPSVFCVDPNGFLHAALISENAILVDKQGLAFFVSSKLLSDALAALLPISAGIKSDLVRGLISRARAEAIRAWNAHKVWETLHNECFGSYSDEILADPGISDMPPTLWWSSHHVSIEFSLPPPFQSILWVVVMLSEPPNEFVGTQLINLDPDLDLPGISGECSTF